MPVDFLSGYVTKHNCKKCVAFPKILISNPINVTKLIGKQVLLLYRFTKVSGSQTRDHFVWAIVGPTTSFKFNWVRIHQKVINEKPTAGCSRCSQEEEEKKH